MKSVLVISISSGENELSESIESIHSQEGVDFDLVQIQGLSNLDAHEKLYEIIMVNATKFLFFVKIDGDMVFSSSTKLLEMVEAFKGDVQTDQGVFTVLDFYTQKAIMGMHMYSNRCKWGARDPLFTDKSPIFPGKRKLFWESPSPVARHSPNPSVMQAFQFGFHRCLKVIQRDRFCPNPSQLLFQFNLLKNVYEQYLTNKDIRRKAALFGACEAIRNRKIAVFKTREQFNSYEPVLNRMKNEACNIDEKINKTWGTGFLHKNIVLNTILFKPWLRIVFCALYRRVKAIILW